MGSNKSGYAPPTERSFCFFCVFGSIIRKYHCISIALLPLADLFISPLFTKGEGRAAVKISGEIKQRMQRSTILMMSAGAAIFYAGILRNVVHVRWSDIILAGVSKKND